MEFIAVFTTPMVSFFKMSRFGILLHASRFGTIRRFWRLAIRAIRDSDNPAYKQMGTEKGEGEGRTACGHLPSLTPSQLHTPRAHDTHPRTYSRATCVWNHFQYSGPAGWRRIRWLRAGKRSGGPGPPVYDYRGRDAPTPQPPSHCLGPNFRTDPSVCPVMVSHRY